MAKYNTSTSAYFQLLIKFLLTAIFGSTAYLAQDLLDSVRAVIVIGITVTVSFVAFNLFIMQLSSTIFGIFGQSSGNRTDPGISSIFGNGAALM